MKIDTILNEIFVSKETYPIEQVNRTNFVIRTESEEFVLKFSPINAPIDGIVNFGFKSLQHGMDYGKFSGNSIKFFTSMFSVLSQYVASNPTSVVVFLPKDAKMESLHKGFTRIFQRKLSKHFFAEFPVTSSITVRLLVPNTRKNDVEYIRAALKL